jgi:hypothetical protein
MLLKAGALRAIDRWLAVAGHGDDPEAPLYSNLSNRPDQRKLRSLSADGIAHVIKRRFPGHSAHGLRSRAITDVWSDSDGNLHDAQLFARHAHPSVTEQVYVQTKKLERALVYAPDYGA